MVKKGMVDGLPQNKSFEDHDGCDVCHLEKMNKKQFKSKIIKEFEKLDIIHADLCGPFPRSLGVKK